MRSDLLTLSTDALAQLANMGLVKRAQRELAGGYKPQLVLSPDGTLQGRFPDGVETHFPKGAGLREAHCSCGAATICRHRICVVIAYQQQADKPESEVHRVSPGTIDEDALAGAIPSSSIRIADRLEAQGIVIEVIRGIGPEALPTARLPTATVRFLGWADIGFARCDCSVMERCEHVVLAVRAFRRADAIDANATTLRIELGERSQGQDNEWPQLAAVLSSLVDHGVVAGPERHANALTHALEEARTNRATWMILTLEAIEDWLREHARRSARFATEQGVELVAELEARRRAARGTFALSAKEVLGLDEPLESDLSRTRLISLGCRIADDADRITVRVALLDTDTGTRMLLRHAWTQSDHIDPSKVKLAGNVKLTSLARGQLVGTTLRRRANGEVRLGATHGGRFSLTPQTGDWSWFPDHIVVSDLASYGLTEQSKPPAMLRPRMGLGNFIVAAIGRVLDVAYDPVEQVLHAWCEDTAGNPFLVLRSHDATSPGALDALSQTLLGSESKPAHVAGVVRFEDARISIDPWALASAHALCIPDIEPPTGALRHARVQPVPTGASAIHDMLVKTERLVGEILHHGLRRLPPGWPERARLQVEELNKLDLGVCKGFLSNLLLAVRERMADETQINRDRVVEPFSDLAIWLQMVA